MIRRTVLALLMAAAVTLGLAGPAVAQSTYAGATLTVSGSLLPGSSVLGQITGCADNEVLTITLVDANGSRVLGTTTTNAVGSATFNVTLPTDVAFPARLEVSGPRCGLVDSVSLARPGGGVGADLAVTGSDSTNIVGIGAACVAAGGVLVLAVRKRRHPAS